MYIRKFSHMKELLLVLVNNYNELQIFSLAFFLVLFLHTLKQKITLSSLLFKNWVSLLTTNRLSWIRGEREPKYLYHPLWTSHHREILGSGELLSLVVYLLASPLMVKTKQIYMNTKRGPVGRREAAAWVGSGESGDDSCRNACVRVWKCQRTH